MIGEGSAEMETFMLERDEGQWLPVIRFTVGYRLTAF